MRVPLRCAVLTVLALAASAPAYAEGPPATPSVGQRVRITTSAVEKPLVGALRAVDERTLLVDDGQGAFTSVPAADVRKIEVSKGRHSNVKRGAIIGASVGVALGVATVIALCNDDECTNEVGATAILGLGGAAAGALIGAPIKTERWRSVPIDAVRSGADVPRPQISVTLRF